MSRTLYTRDILRLATSIAHQQRLADPDGSAELRSQTCGSVVIADVILAADGSLARLGLEIDSCALGQASAAILSAQAIGRTAAEIATVRAKLASYLKGETNLPDDWGQLENLAVAQGHPGRHAAILLPYDALITALNHAQMAA